ncbi:TadE/TadG family type IV pilus assembly protein [Bacillus sp. PS06]|uniref:TadE/TadG family type IV pilus assembly protein n=1 Tax=Bacillus sp. PS06 TaxID=2764176 RepID=UPI00177B8813|nr:TadE family protein [Bacillus sp. PS06]MBD8069123.1 pilus assembly protein [Bacillus sp. PS06]
MTSNQRGQATVELAFSLVILVLFLFAIIDFGRIFHAYLTLDHASREGARIASVGATDSEVIARVKGSAPLLDSTTVSVSITPLPQDRVRGSYVTVELAYPISFSVPLLANVAPNPLTLRSKTVMRVE